MAFSADRLPVNTALVAPILPTLALPITVNVPAALILLPTSKLLLMLAVPVTFAPVPVTTSTFETPATLVVTLPLGFTMTLLVPLINDEPALTIKLDNK